MELDDFMSNNIDFLSPGISHIRKSIKGIRESYNNEWDILAELLQNSIDAIRKNENCSNQISISINSQENRITVSDTGIGISKNELPHLLKPFSTNKENDNLMVGEKGVGLSFVIFSCDYFEITTTYKGDTTKAVIQNAYNWQNSNNEERLELQFVPHDNNSNGTSITLEKVHDCPIFQLNFEQLKFILRTKTILGNTRSIWSNDINVDIELEFTDQNGSRHEENIPFEYFLLPEHLDERHSISLDYFIKHYSEAGKTDQEKRRALFGKAIYSKGKFQHTDNRIIYYYAFYLPERSMWNMHSKIQGLITEEQIGNEEYITKFDYALMRPGIYTSVKGMPTGISIKNPSTGSAGYWSNIFILFEDPNLKFDIGRKSIHGRQSGLLNKYAKDIFNDILKYVAKYVSRDSGNNHNNWDKDDIFGEIDEMLPLENNLSLFSKSPKGQEAQVCAMFYELAGKGIIKDLSFLTSGYKSRYDLYAKWGKKRVVIEFKDELKNIVNDFDSAQKLFDEINCIVCWDITEKDEKHLHKKSIKIHEISDINLYGNHKIFPNATHELHLGGITNPIYVIDLKKIINSKTLP